jgi:hypothetical protein
MNHHRYNFESYITLRWPAATEHLALPAGQWRRVGEEYEATYRTREELWWCLAVMVSGKTLEELLGDMW